MATGSIEVTMRFPKRQPAMDAATDPLRYFFASAAAPPRDAQSVPYKGALTAPKGFREPKRRPLSARSIRIRRCKRNFQARRERSFSDTRGSFPQTSHRLGDLCPFSCRGKQGWLSLKQPIDITVQVPQHGPWRLFHHIIFA